MARRRADERGAGAPPARGFQEAQFEDPAADEREARARLAVFAVRRALPGRALPGAVFGSDLVGRVPLDFLVELDGRELQQPDRLLELRRQREMLGEPKLKCGFQSTG